MWKIIGFAEPNLAKTDISELPIKSVIFLEHTRTSDLKRSTVITAWLQNSASLRIFKTFKLQFRKVCRSLLDFKNMFKSPSNNSGVFKSLSWTAQKYLGLKVCFLVTWPASTSSQEYIYPSLLFHVYVATHKTTENVGQTQTEMVQTIARTHTRQESQQAGRTSHWLTREKSHWKIWHTYGFHLSQEAKTIGKNKQKWTCFQNGKLNHWLPGSGWTLAWVHRIASVIARTLSTPCWKMAGLFRRNC